MSVSSESMTTRELHLMRKKMWDASMENHKSYINLDTGHFDSTFMENRSCPICGSDSHRLLFSKSGGQYVSCENCSMVFLNPGIKDQYLEEYYGNNHDMQSEIVELDSAFYSALYKKGISTFSARRASPGKILDVGCSAGSFLDIARSSGWKTFGLELNRTEVEYTRKKGHQVFAETIKKANLDEKMDVVSLWDVFEHIKDGASFLRCANQLLDHGGGVFIQSPSSASLAARMLQEKCNMFDGLEHVNLYNQKNIADLASLTGFVVVSYETVISEIGVMNNYLQYEDPYMGSSKNRATLIGLLPDEWVIRNGLGYKFQAYLEKK